MALPPQAIAATPVPIPPPSQGMLRVVTPADTSMYQAAQAAQKEQNRINSETAKANEEIAVGLVGYIRTLFETFKRHRTSANGWDNRLIEALRVFNGQYDPTTLAEIKQFGGSEVYARLIAMKCRGASSLLRDVYLGAELPWALKPPADPDVPPEIMQAIGSLVQTEVQTMGAAGEQVDPTKIRDRTEQLFFSARNAAKKKAAKQALAAQDKIQELLQKGGFYNALASFLTDLPLFPFACIKGPIVKIEPTVLWENGTATVKETPRLFWQRISPFDLWWSPGASDIEGADVIERTRLSRKDLNDLLDLPGYNVTAIREILELYGAGGLNDNWDSLDGERALQESRENPVYNSSGLISCLEFHGNVQGKLLLEFGMTKEEIPDELRDYFVQAWMIDRFIIKVQLAPSPRKRHPYYVTSFEKVPGTPVGNALPDILADIQAVSNATLRSLVNNLSIASGPQVVVNTDRLSPGEDGQSMYPWKRWHVTSDPLGNNTELPVSFFHPNSNSQEMLAVYSAFSTIADEISAIPRYQMGGAAGGAGRTSSGLAMLMTNAAKILQMVASNIDRDVMEQALVNLIDMVMLTDQTGMLTGQERAEVMGVGVAVQKETQRTRQLEFLTATANPIDMQIIGPRGRANILRAVSTNLGIDGSDIVPPDEELEAQQKQAAMQAQQQGVPGHAQQPPENAGAGQEHAPTPVSGTQGPQTNVIQGGSH